MLHPGNTLLVQVLPELIAQAAQVLGLKPSQRRRTIVRVDGGGGSPEAAQRLQHYGIKRIIRDLYHISGTLSFDAQGRLCAIALNPASSLTKLMLLPLRQLLAPASIVINLDKT